MKKQLQHSEMTEIEALILINQSCILGALAILVGNPLREELIKAVEITNKEVDKYEQ